MATNMKSLNGYGFDASALGGHDPSYYATSEDIQQVRNEIPTELPNPNALTFTGAVSETYDGSAPKSVAIPTVPESLKNPNKLILTGAVTAEYDGSSEVSVEIPAGGGPAYELPIASATQLGGVQPAAKTDEMTQAVGVDAEGRLWGLPGGSDRFEKICDITTTEPVVYMEVDVDNKPYKRLYVYVLFRGVAGESNPDGITLGLRQHLFVQTNKTRIDFNTMVGLTGNTNTPYWHCNFSAELMPSLARCDTVRTEGDRNNYSAVKSYSPNFLFDMDNYEYVKKIKFSNDNDSNVLMTTGARMIAWGVY